MSLVIPVDLKKLKQLDEKKIRSLALIVGIPLIIIAVTIFYFIGHFFWDATQEPAPVAVAAPPASPIQPLPAPAAQQPVQPAPTKVSAPPPQVKNWQTANHSLKNLDNSNKQLSQYLAQDGQPKADDAQFQQSATPPDAPPAAKNGDDGITWQKNTALISQLEAWRVQAYPEMYGPDDYGPQPPPEMAQPEALLPEVPVEPESAATQAQSPMLEQTAIANGAGEIHWDRLRQKLRELEQNTHQILDMPATSGPQ